MEDLEALENCDHLPVEVFEELTSDLRFNSYLKVNFRMSGLTKMMMMIKILRQSEMLMFCYVNNIHIMQLVRVKMHQM